MILAEIGTQAGRGERPAAASPLPSGAEPRLLGADSTLLLPGPLEERDPVSFLASTYSPRFSITDSLSPSFTVSSSSLRASKSKSAA
ncbi:hypothetical protein EYF80_002134 [Liparis tanakae]|uniref:Uncharacterized protein n=1 Tax=Liparis tanakae TaxID=230148 RepID=A0A4Z2JCR7_9TELE|nr:hypothetical protein EYF80_002134 [Liparis tanakae]